MSVYLQAGVFERLKARAEAEGVSPAKLGAELIGEGLESRSFPALVSIGGREAKGSVELSGEMVGSWASGLPASAAVGGEAEYARLKSIALCVDNGRHRQFLPCGKCSWDG